MGNLLRVTETPHRNGRGERLHIVRIGESLLEEGGVNWAGTDDIDPNAAILEVRRPGAGKVAYCRLCRRVDAEGRETLDADNGTGQDDCPTVGDKRQRFLHGKYNAFYVDVEHRIEMLFGDGA